MRQADRGRRTPGDQPQWVLLRHERDGPRAASSSRRPGARGDRPNARGLRGGRRAHLHSPERESARRPAGAARPRGVAFLAVVAELVLAALAGLDVVAVKVELPRRWPVAALDARQLAVARPGLRRGQLDAVGLDVSARGGGQLLGVVALDALDARQLLAARWPSMSTSSRRWPARGARQLGAIACSSDAVGARRMLDAPPGVSRRRTLPALQGDAYLDAGSQGLDGWCRIVPLPPAGSCRR